MPEMERQSIKVGFAGMTHLGINSAVAVAERGFDVVGFDSNQTLIEDILHGRLPVHEPGLDDLVKKNAATIRFTSNCADLKGLDVCYIAPDVPTDNRGTSDLRPISGLISVVDGALDDDACLVVLSQVPPGFTRTLSRESSRRFYQVETLIFGQAVQRALNPERFIVGCADPTKPLPPAYRTLLDAFRCPVLSMRYESAELAKIAINMFLVSSVSTTNTLAEICERIGAEWSEIVPALRSDRRIGPYAYLTPGLGIAGGNLERDLATIIRLGERESSDVGVVKAWIANSRHRRDWALHILRTTVLKENSCARLALLGLAYKQDTASTKNSPSLALLAEIKGCPVRAFDPMVRADSAWYPDLTQAIDALDACSGADALVVMTPWPEFAKLPPAAVATRLKGRHVIDPYGILNGQAFQAAGFLYHRLGHG